MVRRAVLDKRSAEPPSWWKYIAVQRKLTRVIKRAKARTKKRGASQRPADGLTVITVRDMPMGAIGIGQLFVTSCNQTTPNLAPGWSRLAKDRLEKRRNHNDGDAKGRVLYLILEGLDGNRSIIGACCYHYERSGEIHIGSLDITAGMTAHRHKFQRVLCTAAERVALYTAKGKRGRLVWECSRDEARDAKDKLGFRTGGKSTHASRDSLVRDASPLK